jgi:hypothetical protein
MKRFPTPLSSFMTRLLGTVVMSGLWLSSPVAAAGPPASPDGGFDRIVGIVRPTL